MMAQVLGIDSGGTKTLVAVADTTGTITFWQEEKGLDPTGQRDHETRLRNILAPHRQVVAATLGLPFHGEIDAITNQQKTVAVTALGQTTRVVNDVAIAHRGAFSGGDGLLILAGTGSMAWAKGPAGDRRAGGFGHLFGDEGSAYWIGRKALAAVSRELDGRNSSTQFADAFCRLIDINGHELIEWTYSQDRSSIATLARQVSALAANRNEVAIELLHAAAAELTQAGCAAASRAGLQENFDWSIAGGVFSDPFILAETSRLMGRPYTPPKLPPIGGALLDAACRAGWTLEEGWLATLAKGLQSHLDTG